MKKRLLTVSLAATMMFSGAAMTAMPVFATPGASKTEVTQKIKELEAAVATNEAETKSALAEMDASNELLDKLDEEMKEIEALIEKREDKLDESVRSVQVIGQADSIVDFLFQAESITDLVGRVDTVYLLISANQETINKQKADQEKLAAKEEEAKKENERLMQLTARLEANKNELQEKLDETTQLLASIEDEEAREAARSQLATVTENSPQVTTASASYSAPATSAAPSANGGSVVSNAYANSSSPYVYGGSTPSGFDCSGFTSYVYAQSGKSIPRTAGAQMASSQRVSYGEAQPGDLIFFNQSGSIDHVGIYLGGGQFIGAQNERIGISVESITSGYWSNYVAGFGRY
ncbi:C40 family peptidase [Allofustis seminis]|uniref:C40 family peptidase n=1 Tax=Allofustis seminis TaxID=166939 RepID=UPI00035CA8B5|nr:C40 family peptidase [Allofustis seminis]